MDCKTAGQLIEQRADRQPFDESALSQHLHNCAGCRRRAESATAVEAALRSAMLPVEPPSGFEQRVAHRLERRLQQTGAFWPNRRARPAMVFAAGLAVGLLLSLGLLTRSSGPPAPVPVPLAVETFSPVGYVVAGAESLEVLSPNGKTGGQHDQKRLKPESTVWVARKGTAEVALPNGGRVRFGEGAVVRFRDGGLLVYRGAVELSVRRGKEPFTVELPQGYVMTDEAEFRVHVKPGSGKTKVEVLTGFAWLGNPSGSVAVADGETATMRLDGAPSV